MQVMAANGNRKLVAVECYPGAYQGDALLYLASPSSTPVGPLKLQVYEDPGTGHVKLETATTILGVLDFARSTGTLTVFDKFRGVGDCGIYSTYRLEGSRLVLIAGAGEDRMRRQAAVLTGALAEAAGVAIGHPDRGIPLRASAWPNRIPLRSRRGGRAVECGGLENRYPS